MIYIEKKKTLIVTSGGRGGRKEGHDRDMGFRDTVCFVKKQTNKQNPKNPTGMYFTAQGNIATIL